MTFKCSYVILFILFFSFYFISSYKATIIKNLNENLNYEIINNKNDNNSQNNLSVFIAITSGPYHSHLRNAARDTWLIPCKVSINCDYRFFVDIIHHMKGNLSIEMNKYNDIVLRDFCDLMKRHPNNVNYGNSPPTEIHKNTTTIDYFYIHRIFYKIDWKVCFMKWIISNNCVASMIVFVEDDSFICMKNLIYQANLLHNSQVNFLPYRTGTPMYDGYDDSSTIMSKEVIESFNLGYPFNGLNCSNISIKLSEMNTTLAKRVWLSWGNSWISTNCNWKKELNQSFQLKLNYPFIDCFKAFHSKFSINNNETSFNLYENSTLYSKLSFPCSHNSLIYHNNIAAEKLINHKTNDLSKDLLILKNLCKYMLLIDKIKDPSHMKYLWNITNSCENSTENSFKNSNQKSNENSFLNLNQIYFNYSSVFMYENEIGWLKILNDFNKSLKIKCSNASYQINHQIECQTISRRLLQETKLFQYFYL